MKIVELYIVIILKKKYALRNKNDAGRKRNLLGSDEKWNLHYQCTAYTKGNYCKYILRLAKKLGLTEGEFSQKFHLSNSPIEESIQESKWRYNLNLSAQNQGHPDYTDVEFKIELDNKITKIREKYKS